MTEFTPEKVRRVRRRRITIAVLVFITAGLLIGGGLAGPHLLHKMMYGKLEERQRAVLTGTDFDGLAKAMRELWESVSESKREQSVEINPSAPGLPAPINTLDAHFICVFKSGVDIELGGQWGHYGFESFYLDAASDTNRADRREEFPSKKLVADLWFYAEIGVPDVK